MLNAVFEMRLKTEKKFKSKQTKLLQTIITFQRSTCSQKYALCKTKKNEK